MVTESYPNLGLVSRSSQHEVQNPPDGHVWCGERLQATTRPDLLWSENWSRIWKGDFLVADIEELDNLDTSEIRARRLNAKEIIAPKIVKTSDLQSPMSENPLLRGTNL